MPKKRRTGGRAGRRILTCLLAAAMLVSGIPLAQGTTPEAHAAGNAAPATMEQIESTRNTNSGFYAMTKVVDGKLYIWGNNNSYALGLASYKDKDTQEVIEVKPGTVIPYPVMMPEGTFDGDVIQVIIGCWTCAHAVLTDKGSLYIWGDGYNYLDTLFPNGRQVPNKVDISATNGAKLTYISTGGGRVLFAKDENGKWYVLGGTSTTSGSPSTTNLAAAGYDGSKLWPISDEYLSGIGDRTIKDIKSISGGVTAILCTDGRLFTTNNGWWAGGWGQNMGGSASFGKPYDLTAGIKAQYTTKAAVEVNADLKRKYEKLAEKEVLFTQIAAEDTSFIGLDVDGNVWGWGCDHAEKFGPWVDENPNCNHGGSHQGVATPVKFYDASIYGKKAVYGYVTNYNTYVLCEDNSIYASGTNTNGMISPTLSSGAHITSPKQILEEVSQSDTVVGLAPTSNSVTVFTLKGDAFFTGSNSGGAAGNGTTQDFNPGEVAEVIPDMPPSKPYTKNRMYFEIEVNRLIGNQTKKICYVANPTEGHPYQVTKTVEGSAPVELPDGMTGEDAIPAGQNFNLNVYFEDFGKIHTFLVPVRFNPTYVKAVNAAGEQYPNSTVTAGIGISSGIRQTFTSENWANGSLGAGVEGTYPKINNKDGWLSVLGYSNAYKAQIEGTQKMFSASFTAVAATPKNLLTLFEVATQQNKLPAGAPGFDVASKQEFDYGAYWSINNPNTEDEVSSYAFETGAFPYFTTTVKSLQGITLDIVRGEGDPVDSAADVPGANQGDKAINNKNKDVIYTVKVKTNPEDASFPQVNWTITLMKPDNGTAELGDYISIVEQKDTYIKFKLPDSFSQTDLGQIRFDASAKINSALTATMDVYVKSFDPPEFIHITEKMYSGNTADAVPSVEEKIYQNKLEPEDMPEGQKENRVYTVTFPTVAEGVYQNKQVTWSLLDSSGNPLDTSKDSCPLRIMASTPATDSTDATVTIQPLKTTYGEDYVILKVESLYDPDVSDSIRIKVQFKASELKFKQNIVRLPFNTAKNLEDLLEIAPQDVYSTDLEWTFTPMSTTTAYINFNGTGNISSNETATPLAPEKLYETIKVKDKISGKTASIDVSVIDLDSPLNIDDIIVKNLLGTKDDTVEIKANLQVGDVIRFYTKYESAEAYITTGELESAQTPYFQFSVPGLLDSAGGEVAVSVERQWGDGGRMETSRIPVTYLAEPSKVYGYAALSGKSQSSAANQGIRVDIDGIGGSQTVYTDENGRFEFTEYIRPGNYTLTISQTRYLTRVIEPNSKTGYQGLVIPAAEEFLIATQSAPIKLYPGDINMDNIIDYRDLDIYVKNWVGQINPDLPGFNLMDFSDLEPYAAIGTDDLNLMLIHYGWPYSKYANWVTPAQ